MKQVEQYYLAQSETTDPAERAALYAGLPRDVACLCEVAQGLVIHVIRGNRYNVTLPAERMTQIHIYISDMSSS